MRIGGNNCIDSGIGYLLFLDDRNIPEDATPCYSQLAQWMRFTSKDGGLYLCPSLSLNPNHVRLIMECFTLLAKWEGKR